MSVNTDCALPHQVELFFKSSYLQYAAMQMLFSDCDLSEGVQSAIIAQQDSVESVKPLLLFSVFTARASCSSKVTLLRLD